MERANVVIIGGGIVGLSIAAELLKSNEGVFVLERNKRIGQEISSRNSGVIHSGFHYPKNSLKAKLCVQGNRMIYDICKQNNIACKRLGKITVAIGEEEIKELYRLKKQGEENGVEGLEILDGKDVMEMERNIRVDGALYSPSSGIIEPNELVEYYRGLIERRGGAIAVGTEVTSIKTTDSGYEIAGTSNGENFVIATGTVINSAGLNSDKIAEMVGLDTEKLGYKLHYCKGDYFRIIGHNPVRHLVYPVPSGAGLGIHLTPDISGSVRMGPNAYYVERIDYSVSSTAEEFRNDVKRYFPDIVQYLISEDSSGIRPKLQGPGDSFRDFVISEETEKGLPGFINLIGIESPGLTAAPAIAEYVSGIFSSKVK